MFSLHLTCIAEQAEAISFQLWEAGTVGVREEDRGSNVELIAAFEDFIDQDQLKVQFNAYDPTCEREEDIDWEAATEESWPPREVGERIFLAAIWNKQPTPTGRVRIVHNPGLASGTGEHPCTQLALESLEHSVQRGCLVVDVGTGSGILAVGALHLGAKRAVALDLDFPSLATARENFELNQFEATLAMGSAECISTEAADIVVANISGTVLLSLSDELLRITRPQGWLILTGFPESELAVIQAMFGPGEVTGMNEWRCLRLRL